MPLFQYFGCVGSFLLAVLFVANWCVSAPIGPAPGLGVPRDQKTTIRIHTDHKWPERVVFDTSPLAQAHNAGAETGRGESESPVAEKRQPFDAFAEMPAIAVRPCFRPPCSTGQAREREASRGEMGAPSHIRSRVAARKDVTFPNRPHKPPGRS
jgi:hypothetical protein